MKQLLILALFLLLPACAQAFTCRGAWTVAPGATVPAATYLLEENIGGTWGNLQGVTGPTSVTAPTKQYDVARSTPGTYTFGVTPVAANGIGGTRKTGVCSASGSDENITVIFTFTP